FNASGTEHVDIAGLNATQAVVVCRDAGNFNFGTANLITINNLTPTIGADATFNSATTSHISIAALDGTRCLVAYADGGNGNFGTAAVGTVAGNALIFGPEQVYVSTITGQTSVSASSGGAALIGFHNSAAGGAGMAVSANVLG